MALSIFTPHPTRGPLLEQALRGETERVIHAARETRLVYMVGETSYDYSPATCPGWLMSPLCAVARGSLSVTLAMRPAAGN